MKFDPNPADASPLRRSVEDFAAKKRDAEKNPPRPAPSAAEGEKTPAAEKARPAVKSQAEKKKSAPEQKTERRPGRPGTGEHKRVCILVPERLVEGMTLVSGVYYGGNVTAYLTDLLEKDLEENAAEYARYKPVKPRTKAKK